MNGKLSYYEHHQDLNKSNLINFHLNEPTNYPSHFHRKLELTYVVEDIVQSVINNVEYIAKKDEILFVPTYSSHSYKADEKNIRYVFLPTYEFSQDLRNVLADKTFPCILSDTEFNKKVVLPLLEDLYKDRFKSSILTKKGYLNLIFGKLLEHYPTAKVNTNKQIEDIVEILTFIDENYSENITLESISEKFGYNKFHFSKIFNRFIGASLVTYINNIRIKNFIDIYSKNKNANITQLAYSVGFNSMPSFYRFFTKTYNCNPKEFLLQSK